MRADDVGMFWEDLPTQTSRGAIVRPMPPIPETNWQPPTYYPDLSRAAAISIDCETYDPELLKNGAGWARGKGHIVGVSVGVPDGGRWYFPMRHTISPEQNMCPEKTLAWLRETLSNPAQMKLGANLLYDIGWLRQEGVHVKGRLFDVQFAEALLNESADVALETLGQKYLGEGKDTNLLYKWCSDFYGGQPTGRQRANIYRAPPSLVGSYAESDADLPLRVACAQMPLLIKEGLTDLMRLECDLIYLLIEMRFAGVSVNVTGAEQLRDELMTREQLAQEKLNDVVGTQVNVNSSGSLKTAFDRLGVGYNLTATNKPSFTQEFLNNLDHPLGDMIRDVRKLAKLRGTFVESYILNSHVDGKLYGQFHPLRGDAGGTRSGRFSSSTPNLQNLPSRDDELAPLVRGLFVPDTGHKQWRKYDYSQIEYRFLVHFACGVGSDNVRQQYISDPYTDYHVITQQLVTEKTGKELSRKAIKNINFGLIYGMGVETLSSGLGLSVSEGKALFKAYHEGIPFAKATMEQAVEEAMRTGVITTILGRKSRFDLWEPSNWSRNTVPLPYDKAILQYSSMRRAHTHKALNRRLQGSSADMLKVAMLKAWNDGVFDKTGVPRLTVHDELDFSDDGYSDDAFRELQNILENALPLRIPLIADCEIGADWGHTKEVEHD